MLQRNAATRQRRMSGHETVPIPVFAITFQGSQGGVRRTRRKRAAMLCLLPMNATNHRAAFILAAGLIGAVAVSVAASAAHGPGYDEAGRQLVDLATRYMLLHAAALLGVAGLLSREEAGWRPAVTAGLLFILGCILFGGGMILWARTHIALFDVAIPIGGTSFILGWLALALSGFISWREAGRRQAGKS
ncbi:MAG TPA: DUF423 domain-containing protein [Stellaceae bacterium]|jgi:uncharacterized membrane protein YgdD (TMEM256/DUF423 family)|nr:DUF423 domain-containing protein [Stellaceae bacterium]